MPGRLLLDTDVIIDYLRGMPKALTFLENLDNPLFLSAMSVAELYAGLRPGPEVQTLQHFLTAFTSTTIDQEIARQGGAHRRTYGTSHGTGAG